MLAADVLGASHQHRRLAAGLDGMAGWSDFRRVAAAPAAHEGHGHAAWLRHAHSLGDDSVVALDGAGLEAAAGDGAGSAVAGITLGTPGRGSLDMASGADRRSPWPHWRARPWASVTAAPLERPPRA